MSDLYLIREALRVTCDCPNLEGSCLSCQALALFDGVTGLAREGDVVLSAEQARGIRELVERSSWRKGAREALALLASGRPGEEQP